MKPELQQKLAEFWNRLGPGVLPFADVASEDLPLARLLRLSLFQVSVGMAVVLLNGTLNRVMIVELQVPAALVALMIAIPLLFAPLRALIGFRSDNYKSYLGWRRVPYIAIGSMLQFGGLAIMPFALIILSGDTHGPEWFAQIASALAFLLVGVGLHTTQTAGLALATDICPEKDRARVVALLYVMLLLGMVVSATIFAWLLHNFTQIRLIQIVQGAAVVTLFLNLIALWKQEARNPELTRHDRVSPAFLPSWKNYLAGNNTIRFLVALSFGTAAFAMQDILLEPYGAEVLGLGVGATTFLTAILTVGTLAGFAASARALGAGHDALRLSSTGSVIGIFAFSAVVLSAPMQSVAMFHIGTFLIGVGAGLFSVGMLSATMQRSDNQTSGLALGTWGAVQATSAGVAILLSGALRDIVSNYAMAGNFGDTLANPNTGYLFIYHLEIALLFAALVAVGPLVAARKPLRLLTRRQLGEQKAKLADFPG